MAFHDLLPQTPHRHGGSPERSNNSSPSSRATPAHLRAAALESRHRTASSPARSQAASHETGRPAIPEQRQTPGAAAMQRPIASRYWHGQSRQNRPCSNGQRSRAPSNPLELKIKVYKVPLPWTTWDLYEFFQRYGNVVRVEIDEPQTLNKNAFVLFRPAPANVSWVDSIISGYDSAGAAARLKVKDISRPVNMQESSFERNRWLPGSMSIPLTQVDFGIMQQEKKMLVMHTTTSPNLPGESQLTLDLNEKALFVTFIVQRRSEPGRKQSNIVSARLKMRINIAHFDHAYLDVSADGDDNLTFSLECPPMFFRKTANIKATHDDKSTLWDERQTWFRQTDIDHNPLARRSAVSLRKQDCIIDTGRWLTYRLHFTRSALRSPSFDHLCQALTEHNVKVVDNATVEQSAELYDRPDALWSWLQPAPSDHVKAGSFLAELHEMAEETTELPFLLRYQLEVCLSHGTLHECNMTRDFIKKLGSIEPRRAMKVLQKVSDSKTRYFDPMHIFRLQSQVSVVDTKRPGYCTRIPSAIVTPTTTYFSTPVLETSNRVIRKFQQHEDHFLRVKFMDDGKWRVQAQDDRLMDEVFSRIKRTLTYGIKLGGRHYEFLAFGSSQFREHGAYFFASTNTLDAAKIRQWMGNFTSIKNIAKYCSRLGQCFSTTRAIPHAVTIERISDVERNGFCFTDGVGKISPFLARMIANHFKMPNSEQDYPSMFQFRLAGCKGVLTVEPSLKGMTIQIRPSQEKFPASFYGLEICRISQFSAANLNAQLILVLSALGVPDAVFVAKLKRMLSEMSQAMADERKALSVLQKNVDFNQMTLTLCNMILDGFMEAKDPFFVTCLRLWRSWSLKYLKEKARIFVEDGTFVLGSTDETATLKGHYDHTATLRPGKDAVDDLNDPAELPEIFLQIPDVEGSGRYRVIKGLCFVARNPSLHPGDVRVVRAVDVPALKHLKNCVIFPQTGDRDVPNMLSGGDLDGDDYIISWDQDLMPREQNHPAMDYTGPPPVVSEGQVTTEQMTTFFVNHIKHDNLSRIAVAHRYHADALDEGIKHPKCLELAHLHSQAVDAVKTGKEVVMPKELRVQRWPHWSEPKNKAKRKVYISHKVLGKLYDEVHLEPFKAAWEMPFDERILKACETTTEILKDAREVKGLYDEAVRRLMKQHGIQSEFEVWTTFVLEHHREISDYKFGELIGEISATLRQEYRDLCYEKAGANATVRDWEKMKPFIVAMYVVTAQEVAEAKRNGPGRGSAAAADMPFISFPWIFQRELGLIATEGRRKIHEEAIPRPGAPRQTNTTRQLINLVGDDFAPLPLPEVSTAQGPVREGQLLDLFHDEVGGNLKFSSLEPEVVSPKPRQDSAQETIVIVEHREEQTDVESNAQVPSLEVPAVTIPPSAEVLRLKRLYDEASLPTDSAIQVSPSAALQEDNIARTTQTTRDAAPVVKKSDKPPRVEINPQKASSSKLASPNVIYGPTHRQDGENKPANSRPPVTASTEVDSEDECEEVTINFSNRPSGLDKLAALIGFQEDE